MSSEMIEKKSVILKNTVINHHSNTVLTWKKKITLSNIN